MRSLLRSISQFTPRHNVAGALLSALLVATTLAATGCGTTRTSASARTATEQLLISDAIDRAVGQVNFRAMAGQSVYLEDSALSSVTDRQYLSSSLRQHMLASGCVLRDKPDKADFVVEARAGAVGTDSHDLMFGIPATQVPQFISLGGVVPSAIPEVALSKRQEQRGLAKVAVFAYHRETGMPVWQSGMAMSESTAKNFWVMGAGPFQKGTIYNGTNFAGAELKNALAIGKRSEDESDPVALGQEASFASPLLFAAKDEEEQPAGNIPPPKMASKPGGGK
ncbi:hypothetical protein NG895_29150 [Aeoliella sp. ICT_H6.2]|uniref:Uncharacterized protein n=1 Tax=Aeoliella straminimaris TaxID=2954799 RepID=A0A9X2FIM0_9BACT|nr:DUF6655 family protein [Aeoliella straminimaris]MCO6047989.1 hypothetical protein [Aeoliella straminimaris]